MNGISTLTQKGQVAIPKAIRDYFNLKAFDKLYFEIKDNKIVANPISPLLQMRGIVKSKHVLTKKAIKATIRKAALKKFENKNKSV